MLNFSDLLQPAVLLSRLLILLIALPVHELAHAFAAYRLGDVTARDFGRLSLNPLDHLDPLGALMIMLGGFGWAKPVPVNPYALYRSRSSTVGFAIVAFAGPLSNLFLAALCAVPLRIHLVPNGFMAGLVDDFIWINIVLAIFNLIPIPPLDGSRIALAVLPPEWGEYILRLEQGGLGMIIVIALAITGIAGFLISPPANMFYSLITGF
jgi:Zn-dependent protease